MQILIDESGNLGKQGKYFVIAALVPNNKKRIKNLIKNSCVKFGVDGVPLKEIHAYELSLPQKQDIANRLVAKDDFSCSYIVVEKKYIDSRLLIDKNLCFNYVAKYLFAPIV